jgi:1-deoxy-D-xylulose-5-phosphate synthase
MKEIPLGTGEVLREGTDLCILAVGNMVGPAHEAAERLEKKGLAVGVANCRFIKPLDEALILKAASRAGGLITVEENALQGGFGSAVLELLEEHNVRCPVRRLGVPDGFVEHGTQAELRAGLGLDADGITKTAIEFAEELEKGEDKAACRGALA